jgi:hypothetical protein
MSKTVRPLVVVEDRVLPGFLAVAFLLVVGCAADERPDLDAPEYPCRVVVEFQAELGHVDDPAGILEWNDTRNIARTSEGRWIVRPLLVPQLLVYAPDGTFERTIGRLGEGPGEFRDHSSISVDRSDSIWVSDHGRIVVLDPSGSHARTVVNPGNHVEGFTPSNEPYSLATYGGPSARTETLHPGTTGPSRTGVWCPAMREASGM